MSTSDMSNALPTKDEYFRQLMQAPALFSPAIGLFVLGMVILSTAIYQSIAGGMPMWVATLMSGFGIYFLFSVAHDSTHRSVSRYRKLNEFLGRISMMLLVPIAPFDVVRWVHTQHHAHTNSSKDPDNFIHHGRWWTLPLRWANFDMYYVVYFFRHGGDQVKRHIRMIILSTVIFVSVISALVMMGYGLEVLCLWFLGTRIALTMIACVFVFLPHYPGDVSSAENKYQASTIRRGWEWLLTPVLVYQNYHLIHHLYPTAPFYNYLKIWHLKYDEIVANKPAIQNSFSLTPVNQ